MNLLINLYNQIGAGPRNISLNLIEELRNIHQDNQHFFVIVPDFGEYHRIESTANLTLIKLPRYESLWMKIVYRPYLEYIKLPQLTREHSIDSVLAFGNFLMSPIKVKKTVLLHHPYLFDDRQLARLKFFARSVERIKRVVFGLTLKNVHQVVVQSEYVLGKLREKWPRFRGAVHVIENPVSSKLETTDSIDVDALINARRTLVADEVVLLYVSRYYPHKNHGFLLPLSQALSSQGIRHRILVTINPLIEGASQFLSKVDENNLPIVNLGEVDQSELRSHYENAHVLIFPSHSETFGNPLIEAMGYGLPVIAPDLEYSQAVLAKAGVYYIEDDVADCVNKIRTLVEDGDYYQAVSRESRIRFAYFPNASEWVQRYLALL